MRKKSLAWLMVSLCVVLGALNVIPAWAADDEAAGRVAEQAGKLREAVKHYVAALQSATEGSAADQRLRENIIMLVQKLKPPPAVLEEVITYEGRAEAAVRNAKTKEDYLDAVKEYRKALRVAPWVARNYWNLGVVLEKAEQPAEAIRNLKLYLLAAPNAPDAIDARKKIAGLEYEVEKRAKVESAEAERRHTAEQAKRREEEQRREALQRISGLWIEDAPIDVGSRRYRIDVTRANFEITQISAYNILRKEWITMNQKSYFGTIANDGLRGFLIMEKAYEQDTGTHKCIHPPGNYPMTGKLSSDGNKLKISSVRQSNNRACPPLESELTLVRER